jgi:hypothetical protein
VKGTHASLTLTVRIADMDRHRLFIWELRELWFAMYLLNDPRAEELERILDRYTDGGDDEHEVDTT